MQQLQDSYGEPSPGVVLAQDGGWYKWILPSGYRRVLTLKDALE